MKKDITTKKDIEKLVNLFYDKVKLDTTLNHYFTNVIPVNWENHLQIMYKFWENVLFYTGNYNGNPMQKHFALHEKCPLTMKAFHQWTKIFNETVDELFEGENASTIKQKAQSIATIMQIKMFKG
jgi:hemoglobin